MAVVKLTDAEFFADWMRYFGSQNGPRLMGWLVLCAALGNELTVRDLRDNGVLSKASRYRYVGHLLGYAENLRSRGLLDADEALEPGEALWRVGHMVRSM